MLVGDQSRFTCENRLILVIFASYVISARSYCSNGYSGSKTWGIEEMPLTANVHGCAPAVMMICWPLLASSTIPDSVVVPDSQIVNLAALMRLLNEAGRI